MPALLGVLETALYVADLRRSVDFYRRVFGLRKLDGDDRFCAFEVPGRQVLLLFQTGGSADPIPLPFGTIPPHDATGQLHLAFSIAASELPTWEAHLHQHGIPIESRVRWPRGGNSLYFRDPDGHLVELATAGLWWPMGAP